MPATDPRRMNQDLKRTLWAAADKLRSSMDAAEYKHIVLGLIFLKYISDAFEERRDELTVAFADESHDLYLPDAEDRMYAAEERDYYTMVNCFWVPGPARWETIRANAKQFDIGTRIDLALDAIEADNPRLKGILDKRFGRAQLEPGKLGELIDLISTIGFTSSEGHQAKDLLGEVYEYFLGQFANAEGKKGGQFYTPASVVKVLVEVLAPHTGKVYDPCCGSGGMFVQSEKFIESHGGQFGDISIYGQEANPTTWRLVAMNLAIRGMDCNLGKEPADTFHRDQHPDLKADYVLANPPFNISDWGGERLQEDKRWMHGTPPAGNANYGWLQHILHHLGPRGQAGVVLANGSMSSNQNMPQFLPRGLQPYLLSGGGIGGLDAGGEHEIGDDGRDEQDPCPNQEGVFHAGDEGGVGSIGQLFSHSREGDLFSDDVRAGDAGADSLEGFIRHEFEKRVGGDEIINADKIGAIHDGAQDGDPERTTDLTGGIVHGAADTGFIDGD